MRLIIGPLKVELDPEEDPSGIFRGLFRQMDNSELSEPLGVTPRTLYRWRQEGRLPRRGRPMLVDVLNLLNAGEMQKKGESSPDFRIAGGRDCRWKGRFHWRLQWNLLNIR